MSQTLTLSQAMQVAVQHHQAGDLQQAQTIYQKVLQAQPDNSDALHLLGLIALHLQNYDEAIDLIQHAIRINNTVPNYHNSLGNAFREQNQLTDAIANYQRAVALDPHFAEAYNNLGLALKQLGSLTQAIDCFQRALALNPTLATAYRNWGEVLKEQYHLTEAINYLQRALSLAPQDAATHALLGQVMMEKGMIQIAIEHLKRAVQLKPTEVTFHTVLLGILNYSTDHNPTSIFLEHQQFNEQHAIPLAITLKPHLNNRQVPRRLKIGYVSSDFRQHSVAFFIEPILAHHDHQEFEIYCYYNHTHIDEVTHRLQQYSDHWINCASLSDEQLAETIRQDPIDILVDLTGHTAHDRLLVFARKPAPVQVTYLGYPNTTGLLTMDYRITDGYTDPAGVADPWSSETLVRMSPTYFCYHPAADSHSVFESTLPAWQNGYLTFGSFNSHAKLSQEILTLWANLLKAIPESKLLIKSKSLQDATARQDLTEHFTSFGIVPERLILSPFTPTQTEHFRMYQQIDIALDSYPFNGATTTCDTLWMGVPVVTLVGDRHASRTGLSILSTVGLTELIAYTPQEYLNICLKLANQLEYLQHLRATLRQRVQTSPLMDAPAFTRQLETLYREMWEKWCQ